jgi:hypothetical protein
MAGRTNHEIRDQDVQGLKCLRKIRPLLSRLRTVAADVISDEIVDLGWKSRHRIRPDHPVRLICVAVKPHAGCGNMRGPTCDGVLRIVTNRLDLPAELIAEMVRLRWVIEMFFRTFKQVVGLVSLKELEAFITSRNSSAPAQPRPHRPVVFAAARSATNSARGCRCPGSRAMGASAAGMAKRSGHAESVRQDA